MRNFRLSYNDESKGESKLQFIFQLFRVVDYTTVLEMYDGISSSLRMLQEPTIKLKPGQFHGKIH